MDPANLPLVRELKEILNRIESNFSENPRQDASRALEIVTDLELSGVLLPKETVTVEIPTKKEIKDFFDERLAELSPAFIREAVSVLKGWIPEEVFSAIREDHAKDREWYVRHHLGWGMDVRNHLRKKDLNDSMLPTGNWDDYYVQLIEVAAGIRKVEGVVVE